MDSGTILQYDFNYVYNPHWAPAGCDIRPWFLLEDPKVDPEDISWETVLSYRSQKLDFVRKQLDGIDREAALKSIMLHIWDGASSDRDRFERLIFFIQRMMIHPPVEQPLEADVVSTFRRECSPPTAQAPAYPEDLDVPWMVQAYAEARGCGSQHLGLWCNPLGRKLTGDWGMAGVVWDALELLLLREGRCGHQAAVTVQLAQAGGWRAKLLQLHHHRAAELMVDGRWVIADANLWEEGFIGTTDKGELASVDWCLEHLDYVRNNWRGKLTVPDGYAYVLTVSD